MISYRRGHKKTVYNKIPISFMKCKRVRGFSRRLNQQELRYLFIFKKTQGVFRWILKEFAKCLLLFPYQATFSSASTLSQLRINCANYKTVHLKSFPITSTINININIIIIVTPIFIIVIMIACDNFCYFVALAWRLLANGLLIFNLPHTHSSRYASAPFRTLPQLFITLISRKPPNTPLCMCVCLLASFPSMRLTVAHFRIKTQKLSSFFNMLLQNLQTQLAARSQLAQQLINKTHRPPPRPFLSLCLSPICAYVERGREQRVIAFL